MNLRNGMIRHLPSIIGIAAFAAICYVMSAVTLTSAQLFIAIIALIVVYGITTFWYIKTTL